MYQLQLEVEIFEVCKSTKEVMKSEDMFATAENEKQGFLIFNLCFEVCNLYINLKEVMESESMFATDENKMEGFDLQPVGLAAVQVQEE